MAFFCYSRAAIASFVSSFWQPTHWQAPGLQAIPYLRQTQYSWRHLPPLQLQCLGPVLSAASCMIDDASLESSNLFYTEAEISSWPDCTFRVALKGCLTLTGYVSSMSTCIVRTGLPDTDWAIGAIVEIFGSFLGAMVVISALGRLEVIPEMETTDDAPLTSSSYAMVKSDFWALRDRLVLFSRVGLALVCCLKSFSAASGTMPAFLASCFDLRRPSMD